MSFYTETWVPKTGLRTIEHSVVQQGRIDEMSTVGEILSAWEYSNSNGLPEIRVVLESHRQRLEGLLACAPRQPRNTQAREEVKQPTHSDLNEELTEREEEYQE